MNALGPKRAPKKDLREERNDEDYPLGERPAWSTVCSTVKENPLKIMRPWVYKEDLDSNATASKMFIACTWQIWCAASSGHRTAGWRPSGDMSLEQAMELWTPEIINENVSDILWIATRTRGTGQPGKPQKAFGDRWSDYFPTRATVPPDNSIWKSFTEKPGYIYDYHTFLEESEEDIIQDVQQALEMIFTSLQCLPDSVRYHQSAVGRVWNMDGGKLRVLTNPTFYMVEGYGKKSRKGRAKGPPAQATTENVRRDMYDILGIDPPVHNAERRHNREVRKAERRGARRRNHRGPPPPRPKKPTVTTTAAVESEGEDGVLSVVASGNSLPIHGSDHHHSSGGDAQNQMSEEDVVTHPANRRAADINAEAFNTLADDEAEDGLGSDEDGDELEAIHNSRDSDSHISVSEPLFGGAALDEMDPDAEEDTSSEHEKEDGEESADDSGAEDESEDDEESLGERDEDVGSEEEGADNDEHSNAESA